jgi:glyoxylase-like metal-dependent hydrolase (beta-lactamase superfamily II)
MALQIADRWFELRRLAGDVTLMWEPHVVPLLRCNIWHVRGRDRDLVIDTGLGVCSLRDFARDILDKPVAALATHAHIDHVGSHHEFEECIAHPMEAEGLARAARDATLAGNVFDPADVSTLAIPTDGAYQLSGPMLTALPHASYDLRSYRLLPPRVTRLVEDGDVIDLGNRVLEVLHLPGHSPGSIGLLERSTRTLFSGDAIYDGPLIDNLSHSSIADYRRTMQRLRGLPVEAVHAGHEPSFGRARLFELIDAQLAAWDRRETTLHRARCGP